MFRSSLGKADAAFESGEYHIAAPLYSKAYGHIRDGELLNKVSFRLAECYRITNQPARAEAAFARAARRTGVPLAFLYWGQSLMKNGKYEEAFKAFAQYTDLVPADPLGQAGLKSARSLSVRLPDSSEYRVEPMMPFNTRFNDYSVMVLPTDSRTVYFTSSRQEATGRSLHGATGERFSDVFSSTLDAQGNWSEPTPLNAPVSTVFEEGTSCVSSDGRTLFFTRCLQERDRPMGSRIVTASLTFGVWGRERELEIGGDTTVAAHPALSPDDLVLYFTSDLPGGYGGKDLWMLTRDSEDGPWGFPVNLGPDINTSGDEMFPTVRSDGVLFFSSDGREGLGGLDIYSARREGSRWVVANVGRPLNSSSDDFGLVFLPGGAEGFLSSARRSVSGDDIFRFYKPELFFPLKGIVLDARTNRPLSGAQVRIAASDGEQKTVQSDRSGAFSALLRQNADYLLLASLEGYLNGRGEETTRDRKPGEELRMILQLRSTAAPIALHNILYDFARWELKPESMQSLDSLVRVLNDNPEVRIELMSHTDTRGTPEDNLLLSQRRAQSVVDYLVQKGIASSRLRAQGYGESLPRQVDLELNRQYPFLRRGAYLTESYINSFRDPEQQETAHQVNRRTEFKVLQ
jgi:peptidoglycan-associated lipoprotein